MDFAKLLVDIAITPAKVGLAAADAGLEVADAAISLARRSLGDTTAPSAGDAVAHQTALERDLRRPGQPARPPGLGSQSGR